MKFIFSRRFQASWILSSGFILLHLLLLVGIAGAHPVLPTEFYGTIYNYNTPAASGTIRAYVGGVICGQFTIVNGGFYGVLSCMGDDPSTMQIEGATNGQTVTFRYGLDPASAFGDTTFTSGDFRYVNITFPELICGDGFCDRLENCVTCEFDCFRCNSTGNLTGNFTGNVTGNGSSGLPGGGGTPGGGGGTGGGGSGGGGSGGSGSDGGDSDYGDTTYDETMESSCAENWICLNWTECSFIGVQNRTCTDANACSSYTSKPLEVKECEYEGNCFDSLINCHQGMCEEGVDCGGPCQKKCVVLEQPLSNITALIPKFEIPKTVCERKFDFTNPGFWIFLMLMTLSTIARLFFEKRAVLKAQRNENLNSLTRSQKIVGERKKTVIFIYSLLFLAIGALTYSYFFLLCPSIFFEYSWLLILFFFIAPLAVYAVSKDMAYNQRVHFAKQQNLDNLHYQNLMKIIEMENTILAEEENILANKLFELSKDDEIKDIMFKYPQIKQIYKDMMELYSKYRENKNPYELEKDFCDSINKLVQDAEFKKRIAPYPEMGAIFERLHKLYAQYEEKQQLYEQIDRIMSEDSKKPKKGLEEEKSESEKSDVEKT